VKDIRDALSISPRERAQALADWLAEQPRGESAPRALAEALAAMADERHGAPGAWSQTALSYFLDAERLCYVLDDAARSCADRELQSRLWTHAAWSAHITGQLADLPYAYAKRAVRANPSSDEAWAAFAESIRSENTDFFGDMDVMFALSQRGELPADVPQRVVAAARSVCEYWDEREKKWLAEAERRLPALTPTR
jgi:hypothetical protein